MKSMIAIRQTAIVAVVLLFASYAPGEVIFSRRVYKEHGASYQQIWTWNPADNVLKPLTDSPRDHYLPNCDGRIIRFTSPSPEATADAKLWSLNPATGEERIIGRAPEPKEEPVSRMRGCDRFARLGEFEACGNEETLVVSRRGQEIGRFQIQVNTCLTGKPGIVGKCETPIRSLDWSEDGKWLLAGEEGLNDASGQRQNDYYLVNIATMKLSTVASAETAFWVPRRDEIVYVTPQALAPLAGGNGKHQVWVQQLMFFDSAKGTSASITTGLSDNLDPSWCESAR